MKNVQRSPARAQERRAQNHEAPVLPWIGQAILFEQPLDLLPCRGDRLVAHGPAHLAEEGIELQREAFPGRCFLRASPLCPVLKLASL